MKRSKSKYALKLLGLFLMLGGVQGGLYAETTVLDVKVGAKAAAFVKPALTGDIPTAIVFDPANPASKADADAIAAVLGSGLSVKGGTLKPTMVPAGDAAGLSGMKVAFFAHGMGSTMAAAASTATSNGILTISNDMSCVESDLCTVGVQSKPKVLIMVSKSATANSNLEFGSAFLMMVKEH